MFENDVSIHPDLLMALMYGSPGGQRFTQDTPVLPEVWSRCAISPGQPIEGLIVPRKDHQAHHVASEIYERLSLYRKERGFEGRATCGVSDLPSLVTVRCYLDEVVNVILPLTRWWRSDGMKDLIELPEEDVVRAARDALEQLQTELNHVLSERGIREVTATTLSNHFRDIGREKKQLMVSDSAVRLLIVLGVMAAAQNGALKPDTMGENGGPAWVTDLSQIELGPFGEGLAKVLQFGFLRRRSTARSNFYKRHVKEQRVLSHGYDVSSANGELPESFDFELVFTLSLNRKGDTSVFNSVPTTKADASRRLFDLSDDAITWAVIDSGIDATHHAFGNYDVNQTSDQQERVSMRNSLARSQSRVKKRFRMAIVRKLRDRDELYNDEKFDALAEEIASYIDLPSDGDTGNVLQSVKDLLLKAKESLRHDRQLDWDLAARLVCVRHDVPPRSHHGTHVAGILGGRWPEIRKGKQIWVDGMCPEINLMDFDVMGEDIRATEFATVSALRLIRHMNDRNDFKVVHGANLSLAFPHDVTNYACGQTPVCAECETLVSNGVSVVAAAGNVGYNVFLTKSGQVPLHTETSITDPGNAESVITVGSTHRLEPHTYGISYFSSRGPTGDGRMKPDLVAPGEKITAPIRNGEFATLEGTSMAAPHVSGAAALLMARFPELIGKPRRIKEILCSTATDLNRERAYQGYGLVDVLRALQAV